MHPRPQCEDEPRSPGFARPDNIILTYLPNGIGSGTGAARPAGIRSPGSLRAAESDHIVVIRGSQT